MVRMREEYSRVLNVVDEMREEIIEFAQEFFRIPSITLTPGEKDAAEFCAKKMRELGLHVRMAEAEKGRPNVVGRLKEEPGGLGFNNHIDVIQIEPRSAWTSDPFAAQLHDGKILARGSADCKGGMACALMAVQALKRAGVELKGNLQLAAVIDEEVGGRKGMGFVVDQKDLFTPECSIQGDPANGLDTFTVAHKSRCMLSITTRGKQFHAGSPHAGGVNAVLHMSKLVVALHEQFGRKLPSAPHRLFPEGPNIAVATTIKGGVSMGSVPDACTATFRANVIPYRHSKEDVLNAVNSIIADLTREDPKFKAEVDVLEWKVGDDIPEDSPVAQLLRRSASEAIGINPRPWGVPACGMSSFLNNANVPTVVYGCGSTDFNNTHAPNEWIHADDLIKVTKVYCFAAMNYLGYRE